MSGYACEGRPRLRAPFALSRIIITGLALACAVQLGCAHQRFSSPQVLYHQFWAEAASRIYDPASLGNWKEWEHKFDGKLSTSDEAAKAIQEMLGSIHDRYTYFMDSLDVMAKAQQSRGQSLDSGIVFYQKVDDDDHPMNAYDGKPLPADSPDGYPLVEEVSAGSPAESADIKSGDAIISINNRDARKQSIHALVRQMRGPAGSRVLLVLRRGNGQDQQAQLLLLPHATQDVSSRHLSAGVCYLRLDSFHRKQIAQLFKQELEKLADCKGLVFDLRDNPGGYIDQAVAVASFFLEQGTIVSMRERIANGGYERRVYRLTTDRLAESVTVEGSDRTITRWSDRQSNLARGRPLILLINGETASSAELLTGALKDNGRAIAIGTRTFGKGIGQRERDMPDSTSLHITTLRFFTPHGAWLGDGGNSESHGIKPDIVVEADDEMQPGTRNDSQLRKAVKVLKAKLKRRH